MHPERKRKFMKYATVFGSIVVLLPNGLYWYWGNISVYSLSYIAVVRQSTSGLDAPWVLSSFFIFWTLATILSNLLASRINRRFTILIGAAITDVAFFCAYFAVQDSLLALTFTMGITMGFGTGLIDASVLQVVIDWADDDDIGRLTAVVQGSFSLSGVIINEFVTYYINPDNLTPNLELDGQNKYFSQKSVLDKVPMTYLVLGCIAVGLHVFGFLLLREQSKEDEKMALLQEQSKNSKPIIPLDSRDCEQEHNRENIIRIKGTSVSSVESREQREEKTRRRDFTPKEILKEKTFYGIWIFVFIGDVPFLLVTNYYKLFGQLWISDDHFLTSLGTTLVILSVFASLLWGVCMDKFGVKNCLVAFVASSVVIQCWYYFTPMIDRWLFFMATLVYGLVAGSVFPCYTTATVLLFGKTHFTTNFGLVMTAVLSFNIVAPPFFQAVLTNFGWYLLFVITSLLSLISVIILIFLLPSF